MAWAIGAVSAAGMAWVVGAVLVWPGRSRRSRWCVGGREAAQVIGVVPGIEARDRLVATGAVALTESAVRIYRAAAATVMHSEAAAAHSTDGRRAQTAKPRRSRKYGCQRCQGWRRGRRCRGGGGGRRR